MVSATDAQSVVRRNNFTNSSPVIHNLYLAPRTPNLQLTLNSMNKSTYIEKNRPDSDDLSFDALCSEAIDLIQGLSGKEWTDFNLHDPGVTILEQVCYEMTDLAYRSEFKVEDILTNKNGEIDYEALALHKPEDILPSQAVTRDDYRKVIFDSVPEIDNVWVENDGTDKYPGLYHVKVKLSEEADKNSAELIKQKVLEKTKDVYCQHRNLCEDIAEVSFIGSEYYTLHADILINNKQMPADILTEIYFRCSKLITPQIEFYPFEDCLNDGMLAEDIFSGPFTRHGYVRDHELINDRKSVNVSDIAGIINSISGVKSVRSIRFKKGGKDCFNIGRRRIDSVDCLVFPEKDPDIFVHLFSNDRKHKVSIQELRNRLKKLCFRYRSLRHTNQDISKLFKKPQGAYVDFDDYLSIQHQFPDAYGINSFGVPKSYPADRKAKAKQLKGYLLFFEQVMVNFLANLKNIPRFFSTDISLKKSYFSRVITNQHAPNIEELYNKRGKDLKKKLDSILHQHDDFEDRRGRLLDYLLAIYGEKFSQGSLQHFNYYSRDEMIHVKINNKINFLKHIRKFSRKRASGFNYREATWNTENISGLKLKVSLLLGLEHFQKRALTVVLIREGLKIISDEQFKKLKQEILELQFASFDDIYESAETDFKEVPRIRLKGRFNYKDFRRLFDEILFLKNNFVNESFFRYGIHLDKYKLWYIKSSGEYLVVFRPYDGAEYCYLASYAERKRAIESINLLCSFLKMLNVYSEGFHVVEHMLLRPQTKNEHENVKVPDDFYGYRISIVLPSWTARFHNTKFRSLVEETIRLNCPAHVYPDFFWVDFEKMILFETLFKKWHLEKIRNFKKNAILDEYSEKLADFLLKNRKKEEVLYY